jgi:hypothetical protein
VVVALDDVRGEPVREETPAPLVALVEVGHVEAVQPVHPAREPLERGLDEQVVVRSHQAIRVTPPLEAVDHPAQEANEELAIVVVDEEAAVARGASGDVVEGAVESVAGDSGHGKQRARTAARRQGRVRKPARFRRDSDTSGECP